MNMIKQEMGKGASQIAYQEHLEGMMKADGWTVNDYEKNLNIAAIDPDGKEYSWMYWEYLDAYLIWKVHQLGYTDCIMHKKNHLGKDEKLFLVRSPSSNNVFSFYDFDSIVIDGKEPSPSLLGKQLTDIVPDPKVTDFYVEFSVEKGHYVAVEPFTC